MGQVLHGSARTTEAVRRAIQRSEESIRALARRHGFSPTTVQKWRKRVSVADAPMGPQTIRSTVLTIDEEAMIAAFRRHTLLPLDDCLYALQPSIPHLTRSALHRCLQRHGVSRLPEVEGDRPDKKKFKVYPIGYFHIDIAEVRTEEGKLCLFVAIDRTSKFVFVRLEENANRLTATAFLEALIEAVPYKIHTVLTDNGIQFAYLPRNRNGPTARYMTHMFDMRCRQNGIEHRLTKPNHPWTNGQVERMNRTIKEATVKRYHYDSHDQFRQHLQLFIDAYNLARRLKTLRGLTPYEYIARIWTEESHRFKIDPYHHSAGLNILPAERGRKSRPAGDNRAIVNGILWRMRTGAPWRDVPEKYGKWITVYQRFRRWSETGIWEAAATVLAQAMADNRYHSIDSTTVRGHVSAAGAKGGLANRLLATRGVGSPVKYIVSVMPPASRSPSTSRAAKRPTVRSSKQSARSPKRRPAT